MIARWFQRPSDDPSVLIGSGDDAALISASEPVAISTDTLVEGIHFLPTVRPERLARRALAVNLSDMAAMGARPRWFTLALTLPHTDAQWLESFAQSLHAYAAQFDISLIGGDMTTGPLSISISILGEVSRAEALTRSAASPGDAVYVTGSLGDAAAGLQIAAADQDENADARYLRDRFELPTPRVAAGIALRGQAGAAIDVSDGLVADLGRLCAASGCGARINVNLLPISESLLRHAGRQAAREFALGGGDDYEICFTAAAGDHDVLVASLEPHGVPVTRIGECTAGHAVECLLQGERYELRRSGYEHFS